MKKAKTFEQMFKAYKEIRKQVIDAKLDDITCVEISEYNDPTRYRRWVVINVNIGIRGDFVINQCKHFRINDYNFDNGMEAFKAALAEFGNQPNN